MNKWYKFLITEAEYPILKIDPYDTQKYYIDFKNAWDSKDAFKKSIIDIIVKHVIKPYLKVFSRDEFMQLKKLILEGGIESSIQNFRRSDITSRIQDDVVYNALANLNNATLIKFLKYLFFPRDPIYIEKLKNLRSHNLGDPSYILFKANENLIPKFPKLSKTNIFLNKKTILSKNIDLIEDYFSGHYQLNLGSDIADIDDNILSKIRLVRYVGGGAYGKVFETSDGHAFKVFLDSVNLNKDLDRMEQVTKEVYKGKAVLDDMHYFDVGNITPNVYYALMPMIVPLEEAAFFKKSEIFEIIINSARERAYHIYAYKNFIEFKDAVFKEFYEILNYYDNFEKQKFLDDLKQYEDTIIRIIEASYNAAKKFGGEDLHSGNIGYLKQKPDVFFFYDM